MADGLDQAVRDLETLGVEVTVVKLPVTASSCFQVTSILGPAESAAIHKMELRERPEDMGYALRDKLMLGSMLRAVDYIAAQRQRLTIANAIDGLIHSFDALVTFGTCCISLLASA